MSYIKQIAIMMLMICWAAQGLPQPARAQIYGKCFKKCWLLFIALFTLGLVASCKPATEEERIAAINKKIAPEGYLTKTHLYITWPSILDGDKVMIKPVKLKIPVEYLFGPQLSLHKRKQPVNASDYFDNDSWPLLIQDHKITSVYIGMQVGGKPYKLPAANVKPNSPEEVKNFEDGYNIIISRNTPFYYDRPWAGHNGVRVDDVDGLARYISSECFTDAELNSDPNVEEMQRRRDRLKTKASDDHSPANCYTDRSFQKLVSQPALTPANHELNIGCTGSGCHAYISLGGHEVSFSTANFLLGKSNFYDLYIIKIEQEIKLKDPKAAIDFYDIPQPRLDEVNTDLPKWRERVEPTQAIIETFLVDEAGIKTSN